MIWILICSSFVLIADLYWLQTEANWLGPSTQTDCKPMIIFVSYRCLCHCLVFLISFINCRHHSLESTPQYGRWGEGRGASDYFRICQLSHSSAYPASLTACLWSFCFLYSAPSTTTNVERPMPIEVHWKVSIIAFLTFISDRSFQIGVLLGIRQFQSWNWTRMIN